MKSTIYLFDCIHIQHENKHNFPISLISKARAILLKKKLRFNNKFGRIYDNTGLLENYVNQSDFIPHVSFEDVYKWEFSRQVNNEVSRMISMGDRY